MNLRNWMKGALFAAIAGSAAVSSLARAVTDIGTLTIGHFAFAAACGGPGANLIFSGYASGGTLPLGSYSPTGLTGGRVVSSIRLFWLWSQACREQRQLQHCALSSLLT